MSAELANELGITSGRWVRLRSPYGQVKTQILVTDRVTGRDLYLPLNSAQHSVNLLTGSATDKDTHTPAYKEISVNLEVLPEAGVSPLPITNFRYGHPTPQSGVEVQRKWSRPDYRLPGSGDSGKLVQIDVKREKSTELDRRSA